MLLTVNAGSSSLKVAVFDRLQPNTPQNSLSIENIGTEIASPKAAVELVKKWLDEELGIQQQDIEAVGHRVVHGGQKYTAAALIDTSLTAYLESITALATNHMPATLASIEAFIESYPSIPQVACFDTSFFHNVPEVAKTLPISLDVQQQNGIRRFGFHGLSYQALLASFEQVEGFDAKNGRVVMAHLGSGASVAACKDGQPIDMSMGFTPVSGIMMSTRSGDIEPGVLTYLMRENGLSLEDVTKLVSENGGLLGVSGSTPDMRVLLENEQTDPKAKLAIDLFCYKITKTIGAYAAALGGIDSLIFSGGIGERSAEIRRRICSTLSFLGIELDEERNRTNARLISSDPASTGVHVIPAREEYSIITQTLAITNKESL